MTLFVWAEELPQITFIWAGGFSFGGMTDGYERYKKMMDNPPENLMFPGIVSPERMRELYALAGSFLVAQLQGALSYDHFRGCQLRSSYYVA